MSRRTDTGDSPETTAVSRGATGSPAEIIPPQTRRLQRLAFRWEGLLVVLILAVTLLNSRLSPFFLNGTNFAAFFAALFAAFFSPLFSPL